MKGLLSTALCFFFLCAQVGKAQNDSILESTGYYKAISRESTTASDTAVFEALKDVINNFKYTNPTAGDVYSHHMYTLSMKMNYKKGVAVSLRVIADMKMLIGELDSANFYAQQAIDYCKKNDLRRELLQSYYSMGSTGFYESDFDKALEYYFKADEIAQSDFPKESGGTANGIGLIFRVIGNDDKAAQYFEDAYRLGKLYKDTSDVIQALNNLGIIAKNRKNYEQALAYYEEGLELSELSGNLRRSGEYYYNLSVLYSRMGNEEKSLEFMLKSAGVTKALGDKRGTALDGLLIGEFYYKQGKYRQAREQYSESYNISTELGIRSILIEASKGMAMTLFKLGDYKEACLYLNEALSHTDSLNSEETNNAAMEMERQILLEKMAVQDSLEKAQVELERQHQQELNAQKLQARDNLLYSAVGIILLIIIGLVLLFRTNKKVKQKNQVITERNEIITLQKEEIEIQHKEITDSITYAKRIQNALLSGNEEWDKISMDHYILFKPKDVVSGDFYWAYYSEDDATSIWVTADCTGHGVPGAFMSMLGIGFLNEIVVESGKRNGAEILELLRKKIINALAQKGAVQQKDGMDMALCILDRKTNTLEFTGANNPLYIIRSVSDKEQPTFAQITTHKNGMGLIELPSNKIPVGFHLGELQPFVSHKFQLKKNDLIISFTDGYADQFGGEKGKKLKYKPFKQRLLSASTKPVKLQGELLLGEFDEWKGDFEQIDDVCVIGVKI